MEPSPTRRPSVPLHLGAFRLLAPCVLLLAAACAVPPGPGLEAAAGPGARPSTFDGDPPTFSSQVALARGRYRHHTSRSSLRDTTDADMVRLRAEANSPRGAGGGLALEGMRSDGDLFGGTGDPAKATMGDAFPYFLYRLPTEDPFHLPLRAGLFFHRLRLRDQETAQEIRWNSAGVRISIEPELFVVHHDDFRWSFFTEVSTGFADTRIRTDAPSSTRFRSEAWSAGFELGTRFESRTGLHGGLSFLHRTLDVNDSDVRGGIFVRGIDASFNGIAFHLGLRF